MAAEGSGITSRYASWADYQAREHAADSLEGQVTAMLTAMSRSLDRKLLTIPGGFTSLDAKTFVFQSYGGSRLWLRDSSHYIYPLRTVDDDGIKVDYDETGEYADSAWQWDFDDVFVWPVPVNHAAHGEPARGVELRRLGSAPRTVWPYADGSVQITGNWGWETTPPPIAELVIARTRDMRDVQRGGASAVVADITGEAIPFADDSWRLWQQVEADYSYPRPRRGLPRRRR